MMYTVTATPSLDGKKIADKKEQTTFSDDNPGTMQHAIGYAVDLAMLNMRKLGHDFTSPRLAIVITFNRTSKV